LQISELERMTVSTPLCRCYQTFFFVTDPEQVIYYCCPRQAFSSKSYVYYNYIYNLSIRSLGSPEAKLSEQGFSVCPYLWMTFLEDFLVGHKLNVMPPKVYMTVCAHRIYKLCLGHSLMTKTFGTKKSFMSISLKTCAWLIHTLFQATKNSASATLHANIIPAWKMIRDKHSLLIAL